MMGLLYTPNNIRGTIKSPRTTETWVGLCHCFTMCLPAEIQSFQFWQPPYQIWLPWVTNLKTWGYSTPHIRGLRNYLSETVRFGTECQQFFGTVRNLSQFVCVIHATKHCEIYVLLAASIAGLSLVFLAAFHKPTFFGIPYFSEFQKQFGTAMLGF